MANIGYIIPYRRSQNGLEVLVGVKQVLSFKAISKQRIDHTWMNVFFHTPINLDDQVIKTRGKVGTRFNGMLLPGGGKPCFFGGRVKGNESHEGAARRAFQEILSLRVDEKAWAGRLEQVFDTNKGGQYFAVDVDSVLPDFDWTAHFSSFRQTCSKWEKLALEKVEVRTDEWCPELHHLRWMSARFAVPFLGSVPDEARVRSEIERFTKYVIKKTGAEVDDQAKNQFVEIWVADMKDQYVEDNAKALEAFIKAK